MDPKPYDVYIYQHVPKCGGRSFIEVCRKYLHKVADSPPPFPTKQQRAEFQKTKKDLSSLPPRTLLHGHLIHRGIRAFERYGAELRAGKCAVVTIIRDPLDRALSEYFHRRKRGLDSGTIPEWLARHSNNICGNLGIRMKGGKPVDDFFLMIGATERLQDSLNVFAHLAGFPSEEIGRVNTSPRDELKLSEKEIAAFKKANAEDYSLYAYAAERLARQVSEIPKESIPLPKAARPEVSTKEIYPVLIYQEIPKCGGRALVKACKRHFQVVGDDSAGSKVDLGGLRQPALVHEASEENPFERYREELAGGEVGVFTILRDPLERSVAMFLERQERGKGDDLEDWLGRRKNGMCKLLGIEMRDGEPVADPYLLIGLREELAKSFTALLKLAGIEASAVPEFEAPASVLSKVELKPEWVERFRRDNAKDFALFEYAKRKLAELS